MGQRDFQNKSMSLDDLDDYMYCCLIYVFIWDHYYMIDVLFL